MKHVTIVLPTYNEAENIEDFLNAVTTVVEKIEDFDVKMLVVDDYSPDGTSDIIKKIMENNKRVFLINNPVRGLGNAYKSGFKHALEHLNSDILIEMDSDFSHSPDKIPELLNMINQGYTFVIGSRYIKGGSIPDNWALIRKLNSKYGNIFARFIAGLYSVKDCTSGFRAISADLIKQISLQNLNVNGYAFQMNILYECIKNGAKVTEIPINFIDRTKGKSKLNIKDVLEFMKNSFIIFISRIF